MPVTNQISIGVAVENNTKSSISVIKGDIANMSKDIRTSLQATNTLMTQGMIRASSTIQAATKSASVSAQGSFQNIQQSAASTSTAVNSSFKSIETTSSLAAKNVYSAFQSSFSNVKSGMDSLTKLMGKGLFKTPAQSVDVFIKGVDMLTESFKAGKTTAESYYGTLRQQLLMVEVLRKAYGLENTAFEKKIHTLLKADPVYKKELEAQQRLAAEAIKSTEATKKSTEATKKQESSMANLAKRFVSIAAAIFLARRAMQLLISSAKTYEEQAGMGTGGKPVGAMTQLSDMVGQLQVEVGSVFEETLKEMVAYFTEHKEEILSSARQITAAVMGVSKIVAGTLGIVQNVIYEIVSALATAITGLLALLVNGLNELVKRIPLIPKGIKEGLESAAETTTTWYKTALNMQESSIKGIVDSSKLLAEGAADVWEAIVKVPVASGIKYISDKDREAIAGFKQRRLDLLAWIASFQDRVNSVMLDEFEYRKTKIDSDYKQYLVELEKFEKDLNIDLLKYKLMVANTWAKENEKIEQDQFNKKVERIDDIEQRQKEAYEAALMGAKSAGISGTVMSLTPGSAKSAFDEQRLSGMISIGDKAEEMNKAYDAMVATGKASTEELAQYQINMEMETANAIKQLDYDLLQTKMSNMQAQVSMYTETASMITGIANSLLDVQLNNLAAETEAKNEGLDEAYKADTKYTKNKGKLDKQYADAKEKIAKEQEAKERELRNKQKLWSSAQVVISGAEATMNAWTQAMKLPAPANIITGVAMASLIAASTIAQISAIQSQKFATGGIVDGPRSGDQVSAKLNGGEMVLTAQQQSVLWGMIASPTSSRSSVNIGGDTIIVQGNMDKDAADRLSRNRNERIKMLQSDIRELSYRGQLSYA